MTISTTTSGRWRDRRLGAKLLTVTITVALAVSASGSALAAAPYPSDTSKPDVIRLLKGYNGFWVSNGRNDLHGAVRNAKVLSRDDRLVVWVNRHATAQQRFKALQDSLYDDAGTGYDQSVTVSTGLGSVLGPLYVRGRNSGALPLTSALVNSSDGTTGAYVSTSDAKAYFSHPRPYLPSNADATPVPGDAPGCAPAKVNGSSQKRIRVGKAWADSRGNLLIKRVAPVTDTSRQFSPNPVLLDPGYGTTGLCTGGSFPSGHTTTAYEAGLTLATLLPELAPELLARASEAANNRLVLGVHYPLDLIGGRIDGEAALAARWSDVQYRREVLQPARVELVRYLQAACKKTVRRCIAGQASYMSNPYGGQRIPGGTAQIVNNKRSAVRVYRERMTYGFPRIGKLHRRPSVPSGAGNLLLTAFPTLTPRQRVAVLRQTGIASGYPLDRSRAVGGSWQRLNLAAAMSARVRVGKHGKVRVVSTGGTAKVIRRSRG